MRYPGSVGMISPVITNTGPADDIDVFNASEAAMILDVDDDDEDVMIIEGGRRGKRKKKRERSTSGQRIKNKKQFTKTIHLKIKS
jgi:hypothetical protein